MNLCTWAWTLLVLSFLPTNAIRANSSIQANNVRTAYAVVINKDAYTDAGWKLVADSLVKKHKRSNAKLFIWNTSVGEVKDALSGFMPTHVGFVNSASAGDEFMAWGTYDRLTKNSGRYTLPQSFFLANNNAQFELLHPTGLFTAGDIRTYMDSTVFYGDPLGNVFFADCGDSTKMFQEKFTCTETGQSQATFEYSLTASAMSITFDKGYCYQFRPAFVLPGRIDPSTVSIQKNDGHTADITDNLLVWEMLSKGESMAKGSVKTLKWTAKLADMTGSDSHSSVGPAGPETSSVTVSRKREAVVIAFVNPVSGAVDCTLINSSGRAVLRQHIVVFAGQKVNINLSVGNAPGVYYIRISGNGCLIQKKIVQIQ
jgi:hypothetical protein